MADATKREVQAQNWAAIARSIAKAAFIASSQRKGSCTKRSSGKCCQSKLLTESIRSALDTPKAESSIHGLCSAVTALSATGLSRAWPDLVEGACPELVEGACPELVEGLAAPARFTCQRRENQIAKARMPISTTATVETRRLKRL